MALIKVEGKPKTSNRVGININNIKSLFMKRNFLSLTGLLAIVLAVSSAFTTANHRSMNNLYWYLNTGGDPSTSTPSVASDFTNPTIDEPSTDLCGQASTICYARFSEVASFPATPSSTSDYQSGTAVYGGFVGQ